MVNRRKPRYHKPIKQRTRRVPERMLCMYYSSGNYEAFARPLKPEGIEHKSAYFIGTGLAALSAGCFLVRDAQMPGKNIHFFDRDPVAGGACDGWKYPEIGRASCRERVSRSV